MHLNLYDMYKHWTNITIVGRPTSFIILTANSPCLVRTINIQNIYIYIYTVCHDSDPDQLGKLTVGHVLCNGWQIYSIIRVLTALLNVIVLISPLSLYIE